MKLSMSYIIKLDQTFISFQGLKLILGPVFHGLTLMSWILATPIADIFGPTGCLVFWSSNITSVGINATGNFSMALYRFLILRTPKIVKGVIGPFNTLFIIIILEIIVIAYGYGISSEG